MQKLHYFKNPEIYLKYAIDVFGDFFNSDETELTAFYNNINSDQEKDKFLKISSLYKFLIKDA